MKRALLCLVLSALPVKAGLWEAVCAVDIPSPRLFRACAKPLICADICVAICRPAGSSLAELIRKPELMRLTAVFMALAVASR